MSHFVCSTGQEKKLALVKPSKANSSKPLCLCSFTACCSTQVFWHLQQEVTNEVLNRNENSGNYILLQSVCFAWPQHLMDDT